MRDQQTLDFYANEAERYAKRYAQSSHTSLSGFLAMLPPAARVLELGCGGGQDTAVMLKSGFDVVPTDGSEQMAAEAARRLGQPVQVLLFEQLDEIDQYHGVWASACLLHVPYSNLAGILSRVHRSLHSGGWFYASYKAGKGEARDRFGRYYNYPTTESLLSTYRLAAD